MAYAIHINRDRVGPDGPADQIPLAAWLDAIAADSELQLCPVVERTSPIGETIRIESPHMAKWLGHSSGRPVYFSFFRGRVSVNGCDGETIEKLRQLARYLGARVQGDEGEFHDESNSWLP